MVSGDLARRRWYVASGRSAGTHAHRRLLLEPAKTVFGAREFLTEMDPTGVQLVRVRQAGGLLLIMAVQSSAIATDKLRLGREPRPTMYSHPIAGLYGLHPRDVANHTRFPSGWRGSQQRLKKRPGYANRP